LEDGNNRHYKTGMTVAFFSLEHHPTDGKRRNKFLNTISLALLLLIFLIDKNLI
jgi:hypothetical protein